MRKSLLISLTALALVGCGPNKPAHRVESKAYDAKVYHFPNGSVGFQDNGIWYYLLLANTNSSGAESGRALGLTGNYANASFAKGNPPTEEEVDGAKVEEVEVVETEATGDSESPTESEAAESADGASSGDSGSADSGGGGGGDGGGGGGGGGGGE
jgi:hypothetical protein